MGLASPLVYVIAPLLLAAQTVSQTAAPGDAEREEMLRLRECLELVETDPEAAHEMAASWTYMEGNRRGARECRASALMALGYLEDGAYELEALANAPDGGSMDDRLTYLFRAGGAWLEIGMPDNAVLTFSNIIRLQPEYSEAYNYRGLAYLQLEEWENAEADLDTAISGQPGDFHAYLYRAQARFWQERYDEAMDDIVQARTLDPEDAQALLWRGHIREARRLIAEGRSVNEMPF
ncbi:tetratricopeptide repeat protein [Ponticaulis sp.]|uniref:tetratricopeptide repeat protein n=1 Tax=Ponticaulis sp. TaxID=2020902 RepID=UPI000B6B9568|nr:tetratricopeptide repeat protein [Ponticaulis sp.]MAI90166.1 hypothetical protein [Ponticaulis sp.]OUX99817.1 MAG: hypothetical protein CBB65_06975 [Hyphomonadaceae bacterium TMED5]|tara:strand:- start:125210 stop:125917 length:708 start_codon:yes stop_codon:yes gene_type:complete